MPDSNLDTTIRVRVDGRGEGAVQATRASASRRTHHAIHPITATATMAQIQPLDAAQKNAAAVAEKNAAEAARSGQLGRLNASTRPPRKMPAARNAGQSMTTGAYHG